MNRFASAILLCVVALPLSALAAGAEQSNALGDAVRKLTRWTSTPDERRAGMETLQAAGPRALDSVRTLLTSTVWRARRDGLTVAARIPVPDLAGMLARALADHNWAVRVHAASLAAKLAPDKRARVEPALKRLLADGIAPVRLAGYQAFVRWAADTPHISGALVDRDPAISYWAARHYIQRARTGKLEPDAKARLVDTIISGLRRNRWRKIEDLGITALLTLGPTAEDALYEAIAAERKSIRRSAVSTIGSRAGKAGVGLMLRFFEDADPDVRRTAVRHMSSHCDKTHADRLLQLLGTTTDLSVYQYVLQALGRLQYRKAVPQVVKLLQHYDDNVRQHTLTALAAMGDKSVVPKLIRMYRAENRGWRRSAWVNPIAKLLGADGREFLREVITDADHSVRTYAIYAARSYLPAKDRHAILLPVIRDEENDSVRHTAISHINDTKSPGMVDALIRALKEGGPQSRQAAARVLGGAKDPRALNALMAAYDAEQDTATVEAVIRAVGRSANRRAAGLLRRALTSEAAGVRTAALQALSNFPDMTTGEFLVRFATKEQDERVLGACINVLSSRGVRDTRLLPQLAKLMESTNNSLRYEVIRYVANIDTVRATRMLCKAIKADSYSSVRSTAVNSLVRRLTTRRISVKPVLKALGEALETNDASSRRKILSALAGRADRALAPLLLGVLKDDSSPDLRQIAARAIGRMADKALVPLLVEAAEAEESAETLVALIRMLGKLGDRRALPFLKKKLRAAEASVQTAAIQAVGSFRDASLVPFYVDRFKASTSVEVRAASVRSLIGTNHRRALDVLLRALRDEAVAIRGPAVEAVSGFADAQAAAALSEMLVRLKDAGHVKAVHRLLGEVRLNSVGSALIRAAGKTEDPVALRRIVEALGDMGERRAASVLLAAVRKNPAGPVAVAAVRALGQVGSEKDCRQCLELARSAFGPVSRAAVSAAARLGSEPELTALLVERFQEGTDHEKRFYAPLLARAKGAQPSAVLRRALARASDGWVAAALCSALPTGSDENARILRRTALADTETVAATAAIRALGRVGGAEDEAVLRRIVASSRAAPVRAAALGELVRLCARRAGPPAAVAERILEHIDAPEPELRSAAVRAAASVPGAHAPLVKVLLPIARAEGNDSLRTDAVRSLGSMRGSQAAEAALLEMLNKDDGAASTAEVVRSLGRLRSAAAAPKIIDRVGTGPLSVRAAAIEALGRIGTKEAIRKVEEAFGEKDVDDLRVAAARALGATGQKARIPELVRAMESAPGLDVRAACAEALGALGGDRAAAALVGALGQDSGLVREAALRALGAAGAKTATAAVRRAADDPNAGVAAAAKEILERWSGQHR